MRTIPRLVCVTLLGSLLCCSPSARATTEANKEVVHRLIAAINARDFDLLDELVATDVVRHNQATAGVEVRSLEQFKEFLEQDLSKFPDAQQEIYTIIAEEEKVALYLTLTGTQEGPVRPYPATGRRVEVKFLGIMRPENA